MSSIITSSGYGVNDERYPAPLTTHKDVVDNPSRFWDTLKHFHSYLGTKFVVPVISGKELNLHVLYVEVTKRGGYDKVVAGKKWREIGCVFEFSPTTTSASYVMKKHYQCLLHHYEQVYFFRLQGPLLSQTAESAANKVPCGPNIAGLLEYPPKSVGDGPPTSLGGKATGTIDGKIECGYLVSMKLDSASEVLHGVLYHPVPDLPSPTLSATQPCSAIVPYTEKPVPYTEKPNHLRRRSRKRRGRDPERPKSNRSGYNFFFADKHSKLKRLCPDREREFTKMIGEAWNNLSPDEKVVYQRIGFNDKERYKREMKNYKDKLKLKLMQPVQVWRG